MMRDGLLGHVGIPVEVIAANGGEFCRFLVRHFAGGNGANRIWGSLGERSPRVIQGSNKNSPAVQRAYEYQNTFPPISLH